jgi:hypothetical protein
MKSNRIGNRRQKMKLVTGLLGIALLSVCCVYQTSAQTNAEAEKTNAKAYRVTYTITELEGAKHIDTQHFTWTVNSQSGDSVIKLGSRVPVVTGSYNPDAPAAHTEITYLDVGLEISARLRDTDAGVQLYNRVVQSGVSEEQSTVGKNDPVVRQATLQNTAILTQGKPVVLGSLDVPGSTRHLDVEVVLRAVE